MDVDQTVLMLQANLTMRKAFEILKNTREAVLNLFPGKEDAFELIYTPRYSGGSSGNGLSSPAVSQNRVNREP